MVIIKVIMKFLPKLKNDDIEHLKIEGLFGNQEYKLAKEFAIEIEEIKDFVDNYLLKDLKYHRSIFMKDSSVVFID